jgi:hypothetical protein
MSLILDALKKLEREKQAPDRGFLVVAHVPWATGSPGRGRWIALIAGVTLTAVVGAVFVVVARRSQASATAAVSPPAATGAPAPSVPAAAPPSYPVPAAASPSVSAPPLAPAPAAPVRSSAGEPRAPSPSSKPPLSSASSGALPTLPSAAPSGEGEAPGEADLRLNAISQQDGFPVAMLNDRLVREGDVFDGIRVIRIGEAEVEVEIDGKRRVVRF